MDFFNNLCLVFTRRVRLSESYFDTLSYFEKLSALCANQNEYGTYIIASVSSGSLSHVNIFSHMYLQKKIKIKSNHSQTFLNRNAKC